MSEGCEGCFNKDQDYLTARTKAIAYAKEKQKTIVICKNPTTGKHEYFTPEYAAELRYPIVEHISQFN